MKISTVTEDGKVTAFTVNTHPNERAQIPINEALKLIFQEFRSLNQSREGGGPLMVKSGTQYDPVLLVLSDFCQRYGGFVSLAQFLTLIKLLLLRKVDYSGGRALQIMEHLYRLTPGGVKTASKNFPEPTVEEREQLRVYRLVESKGDETKTTIVLAVPEKGLMIGRMHGIDQANIKALGELFVPNANIHFWVQTIAPPADLEALLGGETADPESVVVTPELDPAPVQASTGTPPVPNQAATVETPPAKKSARKKAETAAKSTRTRAAKAQAESEPAPTQ